MLFPKSDPARYDRLLCGHTSPRSPLAQDSRTIHCVRVCEQTLYDVYDGSVKRSASSLCAKRHFTLWPSGQVIKSLLLSKRWDDYFVPFVVEVILTS